ncbi:hypothetical protein PG984_011932 [Apiospora sp. TS-2023a]
MLGSMIGNLLANNGKPLPDWPFHISVNAVVSILSTVLKACAAFILAEGISDSKWKWFQSSRSLHDLVVFDDASRGPWGCLQLLVAPRGMHPVASLGAALIILTLALDPFTQQLIRYYDCRLVNTKMNATLPRSTTYRVSTFVPEMPLLSFIDQCLYNPADIKTPVVCPSGNCTFDHPFSTLGFCATCQNMTSQLQFSNNTIELYRSDAFVTVMHPLEKINLTRVNTTLPSGSYASVTSDCGHNTSYLVLNSTDGEWIDVIQPYVPPPESWMKTNARYQTAYENSTWACSGHGSAGAARCKFDPCVKKYRAKVEQGNLKEELIHSHTDMVMVKMDVLPYWLAADLACAGPEAVLRLQEAGFHYTDQDLIIPWTVMVNTSNGNTMWPNEIAGMNSNNISVPEPSLNETSLPLDVIPPECIYSMGQGAGAVIQDYLRSYLKGDIRGNGFRPGFLATADGPPQLRILFNDTYVNFDSINQTFTNIAEGITQRITTVRRTWVPACYTTGSWSSTCVNVRWPYLAFPAAVVAFTTAFLIAVVVKAVFGKGSTATAGWKSSPLPIMFHGLAMDATSPAPGATQGDAGLRLSLHEMESVAKTAKGRLKV